MRPVSLARMCDGYEALFLMLTCLPYVAGPNETIGFVRYHPTHRRQSKKKEQVAVAVAAGDAGGAEGDENGDEVVPHGVQV